MLLGRLVRGHVPWIQARNDRLGMYMGGMGCRMCESWRLFDLSASNLAVHSGLSPSNPPSLPTLYLSLPRYTPHTCTHTYTHTSCYYVAKTVVHNMQLSSRRQESCSWNSVLLKCLPRCISVGCDLLEFPVPVRDNSHIIYIMSGA